VWRSDRETADSSTSVATSSSTTVARAGPRAASKPICDVGSAYINVFLDPCERIDVDLGRWVPIKLDEIPTDVRVESAGVMRGGEVEWIDIEAEHEADVERQIAAEDERIASDPDIPSGY
jgi:hypothetical protein